MMTQKSLYLVYTLQHTISTMFKPNYYSNIFLVNFSITKERYEVKENPKNMPKDPPTEPINPDNVMTSISSMISLVPDAAPTIKAPLAIKNV